MSNNNNNRSTQNVYMAPLNDYEALFKIDLNFDADVSEMNDTVLSDYITRVIQGHPYYVSLENVVDIIVDEDSNKITLIISNRAVGDHIVNTTNNNTDEINATYNNIAPTKNDATNEKLNILNAKYKDKQYILETIDENGEPVMYEYEFKGFKNAKSLYHDESVELNGNMTRHFLSNDLGNTYFYDEYMNSQINFTPDERINYLNKRVSSLEDRLQHDKEEDPSIPERIRALAERAVDTVPKGMEVGITAPALSNSRINNSNQDTLLPTEMVPTTGVNGVTTSVSTSVAGVNNELLNNTSSVFQNNVVVSNPSITRNLNSENSNNGSRTTPVSTSSGSGLTFRALNNNSINNVNLNENNVSIPVDTTNLTNNDFENVTTQITNNLVNNVNLNRNITTSVQTTTRVNNNGNNRNNANANGNNANANGNNVNRNGNNVNANGNNANRNGNNVNANGNNANANGNNANANGNNANANGNNANSNANANGNANANANANANGNNSNANVNANNVATTKVQNNLNSNNLDEVDIDNISEEDLDSELKNIINDIKNIEESRESKNYKITIGIILALLVIILIGVIVYFVKSKSEMVGDNNSIADTIRNNIPNLNRKNGNSRN